MPSKRMFYRRLITVEVLSEKPVNEEINLECLHDVITTGDCSGQVTWGENEEIDGPTCAQRLIAQNSEPGFFNLTEAGEDDADETDDIKARLEYLRGEIEAERISQDELLELQSLAAHIEPGDVQLLQWAGVPEFPDSDD